MGEERKVSLMSGIENANGTSGERGKERHVLLMHPQSSVVFGLRHFYPFGRTPPENLLATVPKDATRADLLLLGCSDARHALFTLWTLASECNRERGRRAQLGLNDDASKGSDAGDNGGGCTVGSLRTLRFTLNDREPACLARVMLLLQLLLDSKEILEKACKPNTPTLNTDAYAARIAVCFNAYYNVYVDNATLTAIQSAAHTLLEASRSLQSWRSSPVGSMTHIAGRDTLDRLRTMWYVYADTRISQMKPKSALDTERRKYHRQDVRPVEQLSQRMLGGEGPGVSATSSLDWSAEMTGIHLQYQVWGYIDPFPVLGAGARRYRADGATRYVNMEEKIYTKCNPAMVATDHQQLDFQLHPSCNPLSAFHLDSAWLDFAPELPSRFGDDDINAPFWGGPPRVSVRNSDLPTLRDRKRFDGDTAQAQAQLLSKLTATSLEQMSRMCWAVNWALEEIAPQRDAASRKRWPLPVDVRFNMIAGDAMDTCDMMCALSWEGSRASGPIRPGDEVTKVYAHMPNMGIVPCALELGDIDGPGRFDVIESSDLADSLGVLNIITVASPLLKPSPHAVLRTDLRRRGDSHKCLYSQADLHHCSNKVPDSSPDAYRLLTEEDWCTTQVHESAMLLGVIPVSGMVPMLGQFHCMLEAASVAKSNKHNAKVGDLGQRLRLAWKHSCLIDERAGAYIGMKDRPPLTVHSRCNISPEEFSSMLLPYWVYMMRSFCVEGQGRSMLPVRGGYLCRTVGAGDEEPIRLSPYTAASFARLLSHSLRFLKLDSLHTNQVIEDLRLNFSAGMFGADLVHQLEVHLHGLAVLRSEIMGTSDIVRWARNCPWWVRKPRLEGSTLVPAGSPGMCRVVMLAPPAAVKTMLKRRDPSLCIVLEETPAHDRTMVSSLHFCFVKVHRARASGAPGFPPDIEGDKPWHVLSDRMLKVKETAQDDPSAELMVSFLWNSARLASVQYPSAIELELRFQEPAKKHAVHGPPCRAMDDDIIFRTNLALRRETAIVFPSKDPSASIFHRWLPQSAKWKTLLKSEGMAAGLGQRRVGKGNRYFVTPSPFEMRVPHNDCFERKVGWVMDECSEQCSFDFTLHMSNPAARALLTDKDTSFRVGPTSPCGMEIFVKAGEKRVGGKGKKKSRSRAEDLGKGGVDGGLRFHLVVPFPVRYGTVITRSKDSLGIKIYIREMEAATRENLPINVYMNVRQRLGANGQTLSPPLISNWAFPTRGVMDDRRLVLSRFSLERLKEMAPQLKHDGIESAGHPMGVVNDTMCTMIEKLMTTEPRKSIHGRSSKTWHLLVGNGPRPEEEVLLLFLEDVLIDESNECALLDVCVAVLGPENLELQSTIVNTSSTGYSIIGTSSTVMDCWKYLLPMAVERARRTYSHRQGCLYAKSAQLRQDSDPHGIEDRSRPTRLCLCGGGKDLPQCLLDASQHVGRKDALSTVYRAVLPTMIPVPVLRRRSTMDANTSSRAYNRVPAYTGPTIAYTGPERSRGSIVEAVPAAAVEGFGGSSTEDFGEGSNGVLLGDVDRETAATLRKAGLRKMPESAPEWARFERVKKGLPPDPSCAKCNKSSARKRCTKCKSVYYCSRVCQTDHWQVHKKSCN